MARKAVTRKRAPGGGRKPEGSGAKVQVSLKLDPDLLAFIEGESRKNGKNKTQEIERRLRSSRSAEKEDPRLMHLFHLMREINKRVGAFEGKGWHSDAFRGEAFGIVVSQLIDKLRPAGDASTPDDIRSLYRSLPGDFACDTPEQFAGAILMSIWDQVTSPQIENVVLRRRGDPRLEVIRKDLNLGEEK